MNIYDIHNTTWKLFIIQLSVSHPVSKNLTSMRKKNFLQDWFQENNKESYSIA